MRLGGEAYQLLQMRLVIHPTYTKALYISWIRDVYCKKAQTCAQAQPFSRSRGFRCHKCHNRYSNRIRSGSRDWAVLYTRHPHRGAWNSNKQDEAGKAPT